MSIRLTPKKSRKSQKEKGKGKKDPKDHDHNLDPREDLEDVDYTTECDVTVIEPIVFGDPHELEREREKERKEEERKKQKEEKKTWKERKKTGDKKKTGKGKEVDEKGRKKPDNVINTSSKKSEKTGKTGKKGPGKEKKDLVPVPIILISLGGKKGHPLENQIEGPMSLIANRIPGGELQLQRDRRYIIRFVGKLGAGYELIFTRDPVGGKKATLLDGTGAIPIGEERFLTLNKDCPEAIYYQEKTRNCMGGMIRIQKSETQEPMKDRK